MYESDPWDALEQEVAATLYAGHPYGRPVLGSREDLLAAGPADLADFHRTYYRPANAVLVVAGAVAATDFGAVDDAFGGLPAGAAARPPLPPPHPPEELRRVERRHGEVPRLLLALPAPAADHPDHPLLRVLVTVLADGRTSRLRHELVEEREECLSIDADVSAAVGPGALSVEAELHEGADPAGVEATVFGHLERLAREPIPPAELARARQGMLADWVFGHEQVHQQALSLGFGAALFDEEQGERSLSAALAAPADALQAAAGRWLDASRGGVVGWALPKRKRRRA